MSSSSSTAGGLANLVPGSVPGAGFSGDTFTNNTVTVSVNPDTNATTTSTLTFTYHDYSWDMKVAAISIAVGGFVAVAGLVTTCVVTHRRRHAQKLQAMKDPEHAREAARDEAQTRSAPAKRPTGYLAVAVFGVWDYVWTGRRKSAAAATSSSSSSESSAAAGCGCCC